MGGGGTPSNAELKDGGPTNWLRCRKMPSGGTHEACVQNCSGGCNCSDCCGRCRCVESAGTASFSWTAVKTSDLSHIRSYAGTPGTRKISGEFHRLPLLSLAA